jgi:hypothetical protein
MQHDNQLRLQDLIRQLDLLCSEMLSLEASSRVDLAGVHPDHRASATNLIHYRKDFSLVRVGLLGEVTSRGDLLT